MNQAWIVIGTLSALVIWGGLAIMLLAPHLKRQFALLSVWTSRTPFRASLAVIAVGIAVAYGGSKPAKKVAEMGGTQYECLADAVADCPYNATATNEIKLLADIVWEDNRKYEYADTEDPNWPAELAELKENGRWVGDEWAYYKHKIYVFKLAEGKVLVVSDDRDDWSFYTGQKVAVDLNGHRATDVWIEIDRADAVIRDTSATKAGAVETQLTTDLSWGTLTLESGKLIAGEGEFKKAVLFVGSEGGFNFFGGEIIARQDCAAVYVSNACIRVGGAAVAANEGRNVVLDPTASLELVASLTGRIGITTGNDVEGAVIGINPSGFSGAERLFCDGDPMLRGKTTEDGRIVWERMAWREKPVGRFLSLDLVADLGIEIPSDVDYAKGNKVTVKVEGLAKGLKVVTTQLKETSGKKAVTNVVYTLEGVPTEKIDFETQPMYARVTTTYKDKTKGDKGKAETLQPIVLSIVPATVRTLTVGVLSEVYEPTDITELWPEVKDAKAHPKEWSFKGWPAGIKYNATTKDASWSYKDGKTTVKTNAEPWTVYGQPTKAGDFTITATHSRKIGAASVKETFTATMRVCADGEKTVWNGQAYVATTNDLTAAFGTVKSVSGLPTGLKFTAKDVADKTYGAIPSNTVYGLPTKAGTFVVTLTLPDPGDAKKTVKTSYLWKVAPATAPTFALDTGSAPVEDLKAQIVQGANLGFAIATSDIAAKVTVTGLPTGLKLVATPEKEGTKTIGNTYTVAGVASKPGNYFVTFKTVLNGVTTVTTTAFTVQGNPFAATYRGSACARPAVGKPYRMAVAEVSVAAAGTVKLTYTEGKTKYTASMKSFDWNDATGKGTAEGLVLKVSAADKKLGYGDRKASVTLVDCGTYLEAKLDIADANGTSLVPEDWDECLFATVKTTEVSLPASQTFVFQTEDGANTNALATVSVAYDAKKATAAFSGKLYDGTAIKATVPVLRRDDEGTSDDYVFVPFLVIAKDGTVYCFDYFSSDSNGGYIDWVTEDGEDTECAKSVNAEYVLGDKKFAELVPEEGTFTFGWGSDTKTVGAATESFTFAVTKDKNNKPAGVAIYDADPQEGEKPLATVTAKVGKTTGGITITLTSKKGDKAKYVIDLVWQSDCYLAGQVIRTWKKDGKESKTAYGVADLSPIAD